MIERTFDYRRLKRLVYWQPIISSDIIYLVEHDGKDDFGVWSFIQDLSGIRIHADMTFKCRGKDAIESANSAFEWIFNNTYWNRIFAKISIHNKAACQIAVKSGMKYIKNEGNKRVYEVQND